jgi:hypothetical protein
MHSRRSRASFGLMSQSASVCNTALVLATECSGTVAGRVTVRLRLRSIDRWRDVACTGSYEYIQAFILAAAAGVCATRSWA